jgi:hypothetical protein
MDQPNTWIIGQELYGTSSQSAGESYFIHNQYVDVHNNKFYFEQVEGSPSQSLPPNASWIIKPSSNNNGGEFATICYC